MKDSSSTLILIQLATRNSPQNNWNATSTGLEMLSASVEAAGKQALSLLHRQIAWLSSFFLTVVCAVWLDCSPWNESWSGLCLFQTWPVKPQMWPSFLFPHYKDFEGHIKKIMEPQCERTYLELHEPRTCIRLMDETWWFACYCSEH